MNTLIEQIDNILPQTQCGQCSYTGCLPYAEAIATKNETINRCPPGGVAVLKKLAELTNQVALPYLAEMQQQEKQPLLAIIREAECIGCTKCIQACPVDAIVGAAKQLHTVIKQDCTGCGLCLTPCPVDCIDMVNIEKLQYQPGRARQRFNARKIRLNKAIVKTYELGSTQENNIEKMNNKKAYVQAAITRARQKKDGNLS